jgi:hypothetical protein
MTDAHTLITLLTDAVIVFTVLEGVGLVLYHRTTGKGLPPQAYLLNLTSGLWLMLALRAALQGAGTGWIAACLALAGLAHASDLWRRLRRPRP